jgi:hypothetical protein
MRRPTLIIDSIGSTNGGRMAGRKTHVTHAVRPAHHDHFGLRQIDNPVVNVVQQAARAGNDDVDGAHCADLGLLSDDAKRSNGTSLYCF